MIDKSKLHIKLIIILMIILNFIGCESKYNIVGGGPGSTDGTPFIVQGNSLAEKLAWINSNARINGNYILDIFSNESITPHTLSYSTRNNITITLRSTSTSRIICLSENGSLFTIGSGVTLVLNENIVLDGRTNNIASLIKVNRRGTLVLNNGATIRNNINTAEVSGGGGGVCIETGGTFIMNGGSIQGNSIGIGRNGWGGGVYVTGTFIMYEGIISNNTTSYFGGGVYVQDDGIFTLNGGTISNNSSNFIGGGVGLFSGSFHMVNGIITSNSALSQGAGVYVQEAYFSKVGGIIYGYTEDNTNSNIVRDDSGTILFDRGHAIRARQYSGSIIRNKNMTADHLINLTWDGTTDPPSWSGAWDN
ncbi:MAG: hypothetical protein FWG98_02445 [Candidatus Cloacimonetes bacterium]|nr:hypothetical protein [Candidatus Cloacimonadota bacterium]